MIGERHMTDTVETNAKNIAIILEKFNAFSERLVEIAGSCKALEKSYGVLNECHHNLEDRLTRLETEWGFTKGLVKWLLGGSMLSLILNLVSLAKLFGVI